MNALMIFLGLFVVLPIWYYIVYTLLQAAHVDRLVWFLFYVYMLANFITKNIAAWDERQKFKKLGLGK